MRWSCVWANTARSVSFEANDRLLLGRRLENNASASVFFNLGLTWANFQSSGKVPHRRERLIIIVITGRRASRHSTIRGVGIGSWRQVSFLDFPIKLLTSSWLTIVKEASRVWMWWLKRWVRVCSSSCVELGSNALNFLYEKLADIVS